ncbi:hypothetical protein C8R46DRAFT_1356160 [Mycena filopes]|nr:hypothetical protein C8R46DRAFT_1356160 [Mycena filopes]
MLLDLSVELLQEIASELARSDLKNLRAACRDTSFAVHPLFFSSIPLRTRRLRLKDGASLLANLATGESKWSTAKTLLIEPGLVSRDEDAELLHNPQDPTELLASALDSLKDIRTVSWKAGMGSGLSLDIAAHLRKFPLLEDLEVQLDNYDGPALALPLLPGLRSLKVTTQYWKPSPIVPSVGKIVEACSTTLTTLHISGHRDWVALWSHLVNMHPADGVQLRLKDLCVSTTISAELLSFLASYTGLERLALVRADGGSRPKADSLADVFFGTVLPRHAGTLVDLACAAGYESRWSVGAHNIDAICNLTKLRSLAVSVNGAGVCSVEPGCNAVDLLLNNVATRLSSLQTLSISSASAQNMRGARCGNPLIAHRRQVNAAITSAVLNFNSSAVVCDTSIIGLVVVRVGVKSYRHIRVKMEGPRNADERDDEEVVYRFCEAEG